MSQHFFDRACEPYGSVSFGVKPAVAESVSPPARAVNASGSDSDRCKTVQTEPDRPIRLALPRKLPKEIQALSTARDGGVEPTTFGSGGRRSILMSESSKNSFR